MADIDTLIDSLQNKRHESKFRFYRASDQIFRTFSPQERREAVNNANVLFVEYMKAWDDYLDVLCKKFPKTA